MFAISCVVGSSQWLVMAGCKQHVNSGWKSCVCVIPHPCWHFLVYHLKLAFLALQNVWHQRVPCASGWNTWGQDRTSDQGLNSRTLHRLFGILMLTQVAKWRASQRRQQREELWYVRPHSFKRSQWSVAKSYFKVQFCLICRLSGLSGSCPLRCLALEWRYCWSSVWVSLSYVVFMIHDSLLLLCIKVMVAFFQVTTSNVQVTFWHCDITLCIHFSF